MAPELAQEIARINNSSMEESPGEGFHRATHLAIMRGSASRQPWVLAHVRQRQSLKSCLAYVKKGDHTKKAFRYDWDHFKRVLQTNPKRKWKPIKCADRPFWRKLYRLDPDTEDWEQVLGEQAAADDNVPTDDNAKIRFQYIRTLLQPAAYYSVGVDRAGHDDLGAPTVTRESRYFQVPYIIVF